MAHNGRTKTLANARTIDVDQEVAAAVRHHRMMKQNAFGSIKLPDTLFVTKRGRAYSELLLEKLWNAAQGKAIQDGVLPPEKRCTLNQGARDSFITQQLLNGRPVQEIAKYVRG